MKTCTLDYCDRKHSGRGYCAAHYNQVYNRGQKPKPLMVRGGNKTCSAEGCDRPHHAHGYCSAHAMQVRDGKTPGPIRPTGMALAERIWSKVDRSDPNACWEWAAAKYASGYGVVRVKGKNVHAHRAAYEVTKGPIPEGLMIDHMCHNRACINPKHLRVANASQNNQNLRGAKRHSLTGVRSVHYVKRTGHWRVHGWFNGKQVHVGYYRTLAEAEEAAIAWRKEHYPYSIMDQAA